MSLRDAWYSLMRVLSQLAFTLAFGIRVTGRRHVPHAGGGMLVGNHQSFLDPILLGLGLTWRPLHYMARETLFRGGFFSWLMSSLNGYPVRLGEPDLGAIKETIRRVKDGGLVAIFPEGTRTRDGSVGPMLPGFAVLARKCRVPVIPAAIEGAFEAWPRTQLLPSTGQIRVAFGEPISAEAASAMQPAELAAEIRRRIEVLYEALRRIRGRTMPARGA